MRMQNQDNRLLYSVIAILAAMAGFYAYSASNSVPADQEPDGMAPSLKADLQAPPEADRPEGLGQAEGDDG